MNKTKDITRKEIFDRLNAQAPEEILRKSKAIKEALFQDAGFKKAKVVMLYASRDEEVGTWDIIKEALAEGKKVALPRCVSQAKVIPKEITDIDTDLEKGTYSIYEPKSSQQNVEIEEIDLVVVPGVAYDRENNRLGRGKGYYDRFLKKLSPRTSTIGLAFDFQLLNKLPKDSHDTPVSRVITN